MEETPVLAPMTSGSTTYAASVSRPRNSPSVASICHQSLNCANANRPGSSMANNVPTNGTKRRTAATKPTMGHKECRCSTGRRDDDSETRIDRGLMRDKATDALAGFIESTGRQRHVASASEANESIAEVFTLA